MGQGMRLAQLRLALRAFAQTGGKNHHCPCFLGLCADQSAQPDVVAVSGAPHLEALGKTLAWMRRPMEKDRRQEVGRDLRQEEEEETEGKERRKGRRPRLLPVARKGPRERGHENQGEGVSRRRSPRGLHHGGRGQEGDGDWEQAVKAGGASG